MSEDGSTRTLAYFPGCTVRGQARPFEASALATAAAMGHVVEELPNWQCCGAVYPLVTDNIMPLLSPSRSLIAAAKSGHDLVTLCSSCYNVLKRTNNVFRQDEEKRTKLNAFLEEDYDGKTQAMHFLEAVADPEPGASAAQGVAPGAGAPPAHHYEGLKKTVTKPLEGLKVAAYYGCMLLRPAEDMALDDPENPTIMENFVRALGAEPVDFPYRSECCGAYLAISGDDRAESAAKAILENATQHGAEVLVTSCPLCLYNLESRQAAMAAKDSEFRQLPVIYFTQLSALAVGKGETCGFEESKVDPRPALARFLEQGKGPEEE